MEICFQFFKKTVLLIEKKRPWKVKCTVRLIESTEYNYYYFFQTFLKYEWLTLLGGLLESMMKIDFEFETFWQSSKDAMPDVKWIKKSSFCLLPIHLAHIKKLFDNVTACAC